MIQPEAIPLFTGDLGELEHHIQALGHEADGIRQAGSAAHRQFQQMSAFYQAPEAEELFASTAPARDAADAFADKVGTVADALSAYAAEVAPIAKRLEHLKSQATAFVAGLKTSSGDFDKDWNHDADKVTEHQALMHDVAAAQAAFTAAEVACANRITALVGGTQYVMHTSDKQLIPRGAEFYGYGADLLDQAEELPWGTPEGQSHHFWDPHDFGHYFKSLVWDGFIVDGVWGTVDGLFSLVGANGAQSFKDSWGGIAHIVVGAETYLMESGGKKPTGVFATGFAQDSKAYAKEFAKSFVAWDQWKENPARAAGTVLFNFVTLGAGPLKAASAGRVGTAAKVASSVARVGEAVDPVNAAVKVAGRGLPKIAEVTNRLRATGDLPGLRTPHSILELPDGSKLVIDDGRFLAYNKHGDVITDPPRQERSVTAGGHQSREPIAVGVASHSPRASTHAEGSPPSAKAHDGVAGHSGGSMPPETGSTTTGRVDGAGTHASGTEVGHGHGGAGSDGRLPDGMHHASSQQPPVPRPAFMRDGPNPYGARGSLTLEQIHEIQVYRANHEPGYFDRYYKKNGWRINLNFKDESGYAPPQLAKASDGSVWVDVRNTPAPPEPHFHDDDFIKVGADTVTNEARLRILNEAAQNRHFAVHFDNIVKDWKAETGGAHDIHGSVDTAAQLGEARGAYRESHTAMGSAAEHFGETVAEHHFIAENYAHFEKQELLGPRSGNDQFDQVWKGENDRIVVIEAKSSPGTELGSRALPGGRRVSQGSREYFFDILKEMEKRGEYDLVDDLEKALNEGKLEYVVVKGGKNAGTYTGYEYRRFDISKGTLP